MSEINPEPVPALPVPVQEKSSKRAFLVGAGVGLLTAVLAYVGREHVKDFVCQTVDESERGSEASNPE